MTSSGITGQTLTIINGKPKWIPVDSETDRVKRILSYYEQGPKKRTTRTKVSKTPKTPRTE